MFFTDQVKPLYSIQRLIGRIGLKKRGAQSMSVGCEGTLKWFTLLKGLPLTALNADLSVKFEALALI